MKRLKFWKNLITTGFLLASLNGEGITTAFRAICGDGTRVSWFNLVRHGGKEFIRVRRPFQLPIQFSSSFDYGNIDFYHEIKVHINPYMEAGPLDEWETGEWKRSRGYSPFLRVALSGFVYVGTNSHQIYHDSITSSHKELTDYEMCYRSVEDFSGPIEIYIRKSNR